MSKKFLITLILAFSTLAGYSTTDTIAQPENLSLIQQVEKWYDNNMNYYSITALMTIESSFIPFPSEIVIPPAAYIASKPGSHLNIFLVVLFGTIGALLGAFINYGLALWLGRPIIHKLADSKLGHLFLLSSEKITKAEVYFNNHGKISTFVGRLIPGIRQLISIPAGLSKMNLLSFTIYTTLGAGIWNAILAFLGYVAHGQADLINEYSHELSYGILGLIAIIAIFYLVKYLIKRNKKQITNK
jgi:membrane protein DedA with SNARE-associated domain